MIHYTLGTYVTQLHKPIRKTEKTESLLQLLIGRTARKLAAKLATIIRPKTGLKFLHLKHMSSKCLKLKFISKYFRVYQAFWSTIILHGE